MKPHTIFGLRIRKSYQIQFSPLFVTKTAFCVFQLLALWSGRWEKLVNETNHNVGVADQRIISDSTFTIFCNQKLTESCRDHFDSQKFQFHVLIVFLGAVRPLFLLWDFFWIRLVGKRLQIMLRLPRLLCLSNYFMESLRLRTWPKFSMKILWS